MALIDDVSNTINSAAIQNLNFTVVGNAVSPGIYTQVRNKITSGDLTAAKDPNMNGVVGRYDYTNDKFWFGFPATDGDPFRRGLVVHEATHAAYDINQITVPVKVAESLAYLAQALFIYHDNKQAVDDGAEVTFEDAAMTAAWSLSEAARTEAKAYTEAELRPLYTAIDSMQRYHGRGDDDEVTDGV